MIQPTSTGTAKIKLATARLSGKVDIRNPFFNKKYEVEKIQNSARHCDVFVQITQRANSLADRLFGRQFFIEAIGEPKNLEVFAYTNNVELWDVMGGPPTID